jgi:hypothetical protein
MSEITKTKTKIKTEAAKVQKIEKTDLDDTIKAGKKIKIHLICIAVGISISVGASFADGALIHISLVFTAVPSMIQEAFDYLYKL